MLIRAERNTDTDAIHAVHVLAFRSDAEARLVDALRKARHLAISLVAEIDRAVVGHIAFSPMSISASHAANGLGLGPLAVVPTHQRIGIGGKLVREGIIACQNAGCGYVVVLGDPKYYGRFGFAPASNWGMHCEFGGGDAFQAIELKPGAIPAHARLARYSPEFMLVA